MPAVPLLKLLLAQHQPHVSWIQQSNEPPHGSRSKCLSQILCVSIISAGPTAMHSWHVRETHCTREYDIRIRNEVDFLLWHCVQIQGLDRSSSAGRWAVRCDARVNSVMDRAEGRQKPVRWSKDEGHQNKSISFPMSHSLQTDRIRSFPHPSFSFTCWRGPLTVF